MDVRIETREKMFVNRPLSFVGKSTMIAVASFFLIITFSSIQLCIAQDSQDDTGKAVALFNEGQNAHEKGDLVKAIGFYEEALTLIPEFPEAELQRGNAFLAQGKRDLAEKSFRRALELRDDWTLAMASLGSILVANNRFAEAESVLTKAVELDDLNFPAYAALADLRLKTNAKPEELRALLSKLKPLTEKASPTASIWAARSSIEHSLGDKIAAKLSSARSLQVDPANQLALALSAAAALEEGDVTKAGEFVRRLEIAAPRSEQTLVLQARLSLERGNSADALKILNSIDNPSASTKALRDKISVNNQTSTAELETQLKTDEKNAAVLGKLCSLLRTENAAKAIDYCRRASESEPGNISHAIGFGAALVQAKRYVDAVALFRKLVVLAPDNSTIHANLATAHFQQKQFAEAKVEYEWLVKNQPELAPAYYFLAITHDQLGEYMDAMANYQQFLRLADATSSKLEIEKVNLRLPILQRQLKNGKGKRNE